MRHTVATLMLQGGVPVHEVAARLGHAKASMTLDTYAHAQPRKGLSARSAMGC
jgi:integrase